MKYLATMNIRLSIIGLLTLSVLACSKSTPVNHSNQDIYAGIEFDMPKVIEPTFPDNLLSIVDFGAIGDGQYLNTDAIAAAINALAEKGGGRLVIPKGIWLTGPIVLKSNINIYTEPGALVIFSKNKDHYPLIKTDFEGLKTVRCMSPIYAKDLENIAFTGNGIFDGSGDVWRMVKRSKLTSSQWKKLVASGGLVDEGENSWYPSESYVRGMKMSDMNVPRGFDSINDYLEIKDFLRPVMVSLVGCKRVMLDGPTFQNSPAWCIHPFMCEDLTVRNISVRNPWFSQNGDGIDIESCTNSILSNSVFDVGDDAICIKSGKDKDGRERGVPTMNLIVKNCVVFHGHGGFTVGSEMSGGVKNIHVSGCTFIGTDVGLRFKSNRGRGGVVENIFISDIEMIDIPTNAISFNLYYGGKSVSELLEESNGMNYIETTFPVSEETPQFKDIYIRNITCKGAYQAIYLQGLPEMNLRNINLENLVMEAENGFSCMDADGVKIKDLTLITNQSPAVTIYNTKNLNIEGLQLNPSDEVQVHLSGKKTGKVVMQLNAGYEIEIGNEVDQEDIKISQN